MGISSTFKANLIAWLGDAANGIEQFAWRPNGQDIAYVTSDEPENKKYPMPLFTSEKYNCEAGRIRKDRAWPPVPENHPLPRRKVFVYPDSSAETPGQSPCDRPVRAGREGFAKPVPATARSSRANAIISHPLVQKKSSDHSDTPE